MKKLTLLFAVFAAIAVVSSCGKKTGSDEEKIDSLEMLCRMQEIQLKNANQFIDAVNCNMDSVIAADGNFIIGAKGDGVMASREQMKQNLETYNLMLENQRSRIAELEQQLKNSQAVTKDVSKEMQAKNEQMVATNNKMQATLEKLKAQLDEKEAEIKQLKEQLENNKITIEQLNGRVNTLKKDVANLTVENTQKTEALEQANAKISTAYVAVASKADLKNLGLLAGGSLFKKSKLTLDDVDVSKFSKIDTRKTRSIAIPAKTGKLLTQHPAGSYIINANSDGTSSLIINDPARFWSVSNFLVVQY